MPARLANFNVVFNYLKDSSFEPRSTNQGSVTPFATLR